MEYGNDRLHLISWTRLKGALGLLCLGTVSLWAQTQDLATTDDGSKLYFSSTLRLKGTDEYNNGKIFEYANGSYRLIAQITPVTSTGPAAISHLDLRIPNVTGDGSILVYSEGVSCNPPPPSPSGGFICLPPGPAGYIIGTQIPQIMTSGPLRISHNGRYAISLGSTPNSPASFYDFQSGRLVPFFGTVSGDGRQSVADDGTVLTIQGLWRDGQIVGSAPGGVTARFSPDGSVVVAEGTSSGSRCYGDSVFGACEYHNILVAHNIGSGADVQLAQGPSYWEPPHFFQPIPYFFPTVSNDGKFVLYRSIGSLILSATDGTVQRVLASDPSGIAEGVLSGDAHHAYAVTQDGALLSIDVDSGQVQVLLSDSVPTITKTTGAVVPGSLVTFTGANLSTSDGQNRLRFSGPQPPVISSAPNSVTIQVPWETDATLPFTASGANPESPFEQAASFQPVLASPEFLAVFHVDFTPLNTYDNFAKPGETLILYMTGLGPVNPAVASGEAEPADRLSSVQFPLHCVWDPANGASQAADIQFAGLAPGTVGVYQVNLVAPGTFPGTTISEHFLTCTSVLPSGASSDASTTPIFVATAQ